MSRQSRQKGVVKRIEALQATVKSQGEQLTKVYSLVKEMKENFDNLIGMSGDKTPRFQTVSGVHVKGPNPWAIQTSQSLIKTMATIDNASLNKRIRNLFESYKPTLEALQSTSAGLSADQVKEKTGRSRNTESAYLWKLYLAGYLHRRRHGSKVIYKLREGKNLAQVFGEQ